MARHLALLDHLDAGSIDVGEPTVHTADLYDVFLALTAHPDEAFVPTDSMPAGVRWFAEYQPFTPSWKPCAH